jgi:hypothetical protein
LLYRRDVNLREFSMEIYDDERRSARRERAVYGEAASGLMTRQRNR